MRESTTCMDQAELLQCINQLHQATFRLLEKYPDGEQGAFRVVDHLNQSWVLKWAPGMNNLDWMQGAKTTTDLLRSLGYPAPSYLLIGKLPEGIYSVQSVLPGAPSRTLPVTFLPRLLELNELQREHAIPGRKDWHQEAIDTVLIGGNGYCLHASLQHHSRETADLLQTLQVLVTKHRDAPHRTNDIVHGDFQHMNILVQDEQISGVVDWEGSYAGDGVFDLVTLLFYTYDDAEMRAQLWHHVLTRASLGLVSVYCAHLILRQVDWSLRYHDPATGARYIARGQALLAELAYRMQMSD